MVLIIKENIDASNYVHLVFTHKSANGKQKFYLSPESNKTGPTWI
jgi:hypothetical protein